MELKRVHEVEIKTQQRWLGIVIAAGVFAITHADWQHWPALFTFGIFLGYAYERRGNIWIPIIMHFLFNAMPITVTLLQKYGVVDMPVKG